MTRRFSKRWQLANTASARKGKGFFGNRISRKQAALSIKAQAPFGAPESRQSAGNPETGEDPPRK